jgi:trimeric autotransporter adhesin
MKPSPISVAMLVVSLFLAPALLAQSPDSANQSAASPAPSSASAAEVPRLIKFSGTLLDAQDRPLAGPVGVTFALHAQQTGGAALWLETQNVTPDAHGFYTVLLGANSTNGVPAELFASGEARWLEVQVERQAEQPRILLVSVPYALKAKDAETLGGKPASAFLTTETLAGAGSSAGAAAAPASSAALSSSKAQTIPKKAASAPQPAAACASVTSGGAAAVNSIAMFSAACNIESSLMTQALINGFPGVNVAGNNAGLLLNGTGTHQLTVTGLSSGRLGQDFTGFFFSSDTNGKVIKFLTNNGALHEWMRITSAGNVGIGTMTPAAKLDVAGNLNLPNTTTGGTAGVIQLSGTPFLHNFGTSNTFVGAFAGNTSASLTGGFNTGVGSAALFSNTTGGSNTAVGFGALQANTTGLNNTAMGSGALSVLTGTGSDNNTAVGMNALLFSTTASGNTAMGVNSLLHNTTGSNNTVVGFDALAFSTTATGNTAVGSFALNANTGNNNSAFGFQALTANTTGITNAAFGTQALFSNTTANGNSAFGSSALFSNTTGAGNAAFGFQALFSNTTGFNNNAFGISALSANTTGGANSAFGEAALQNNTTGADNSAFGRDALVFNTTGSVNTAFGFRALLSHTTSNGNSAFGGEALEGSTTGVANSAFGWQALQQLGTGDDNIAIGNGAGFNLTSGSADIYIGNIGVATESSTIRIGAGQTAAFMAGINGATSASGTAVFVNSNGQLGSIQSSRRFKDDIADMAGESDLLMKLRPVSFYYKQEYDATHTRQYGLVAEEVAQVSPDLVVFGKDGAPETVRYHFVNAMLLNEVQKQRQLVEGQRKLNEEQQSTIARQQTAIQDLAARLAKLEALVAPAP